MAAKKKAKKTGSGEKSFEEALAGLEDVVAKLESGEIPLEESIELYERGIGSFKRCHELLRAAEKRIEGLVSDGGGGGGGGGGVRTEPFESGAGDDHDEDSAEEDKGGGGGGSGGLFGE